MGRRMRRRLFAAAIGSAALLMVLLAGSRTTAADTPPGGNLPTVCAPLPPPADPCPVPTVPGSTPTPSATPGPTPTPTPVPPGQTPAPPGGGSPSKATTGPGSSAGSSQPGAAPGAPGAPTALAPGAPPPGAPGGPPPGSPPGTPPNVTGAQLVALGVITDPALAAQITAIAQEPITTERPSLRHFGLAAVRSSGRPPSSPRGSGHLNGAPAVLVGVIGAGVPAAALVPGLLAIWRRKRGKLFDESYLLRRSQGVRRRVPSLAQLREGLAGARDRARHELSPGATWARLNAWTPRHTALSAACLAGTAMLATGIGATGAAFDAAAVSLQPTSSTLKPAGGASSRAPSRHLRSSAWNRLVTIEHTITSDHDRLVQQEAEVNSLTARLKEQALLAGATDPAAGPAAPPAAGAPPAPVAPPAGAVVSPEATAQLTKEVADYQAHLAAYNAYLENEYLFYVAAVKDPAQRVALAAQAGTQPPEIRDAVLSNLDAVEGQQLQESALAAAVAQQPQAAATTPTSAGSSPTAAQLAQAGRPVLIAPENGTITQGFGPTQYAFEPPVTRDGVFYAHFHTGLDIAAPADTPLHAAASGTVILAASSVNDAGHLIGYGNYIAISHGGGFTTLYGHLDQLLVKPGQVVHQGDVIGLEGSTGNSTGPHVHFETRLGTSWVDPVPYLGGQVRP